MTGPNSDLQHSHSLLASGGLQMSASSARHASENLRRSPTATTGTLLRARLIEIENQVAGLEAQLSRLRVEKQAVLESLEAIIYPILTLPPEIPSEIFLHYVDRHPSRSPLRLASVCRAWRAVALSMPGLWTQFHADLTKFGSNCTVKDVGNRLRCWLPRAGSLPLTLRIVLPKLSAQHDILSILAERASQWTDLNLTYYTALSFPPDSICAPLPSLKTLTLGTQLWRDGSTPQPFIAALRDAPRLRDVELLGLSFAQISLPWIQLTILKLEGQSVAQCLEILEHSPYLEELSVTASFLRWGAPPALTPCTFPRLRTLKLSSDPDVELLGHLTLPALDSLTLSELSSPGLARVIALAPRSGCAVCTLHLVVTAFTQTQTLLKNLPTAKKVELSHMPWHPDDFAELFSWLAADPEALPALEVLHVHGDQCDVPIKDLAYMLTKRRTRPTPLQAFRLVLEPHGRAQGAEIQHALEKLRSLREQGLVMEFEAARSFTSQMVPSSSSASN